MYRVVLYYLIALLVLAMGFAAFGLISYDPVYIGLSALFFVFFSEWLNDIFSRVFEAPVNVESTTITALILACIVAPATKIADFIPLAAIAAVAVASKYILAINRKHVFNPVAIAVAISSVAFLSPAVWWIGSPVMAPFVLVGGLLVVRKIRREQMVWVFAGTAVVVSSIATLLKGSNLIQLYSNLFSHSSLMFLGFVMLTEPMTGPPTIDLQIVFGAIVGFLFVPNIHIGSWYTTPEIALLIGNVYAYIVSPKDKLVLYLKEKILHASDVIDFIFPMPQRMNFVPGQYMEWTVPHAGPDSRGNRRYFTLASSPTEPELRLGVKFYDKSSTYKKAMLTLSATTPVVAAQRAGDFTLPKDPKQKIVFIAGGIGVTPYRSMIKYLIDMKEKRDIVLFYANKSVKDIVYQDVFQAAYEQLGIRTIYTLTDLPAVPLNWQGKTGRIDRAMISSDVTDYRERLFYLSGPYTMVHAFEQTLLGMGVVPSMIKKDFFPGFV